MYLTDVMDQYESLKELNYVCLCEGQILLTTSSYGRKVKLLNPNATNANPNTHLLHRGNTKDDGDDLLKEVSPRTDRRKQWYKDYLRECSKANSRQSVSSTAVKIGKQGNPGSTTGSLPSPPSK